MNAVTGLTRNQRLVMDTLAARAVPMSAYTILAELRSEGLKAPLQIYRALDNLVLRGRVHRIESLNAFVACANPACSSGDTIVFAICQSCGSVSERADPAIATRLVDICRTEGFRAEARTVEVRGACQHCSDGARLR